MILTNRFAPLAGLLAAALLAGCAHTPFGGGKETPGSHPRADAVAPSDPAQIALKEGLDAYNNGDYNGAIKKLAAPDIAKGSKAIQLSALKYTAFSYCVTSRPVPCRQQFDKALKLDPGFELEAGENGHPLWGPVFAKAKKAK
ncbi:MAG: TssQ family T6SS-associated lipoprotein [Massilia sp.]